MKMNNVYTKIQHLVVLVITSFMLAACSISIDGENYRTQEPKFDIEQFFVGKVTAWGIVQNRSGEIVQRFEVNIDGRMENGNLILDESFKYSVGDGPAKRVWTLSQNADGTYTGIANDIAEEATGTSYGNAFNFNYEMDLAVDGSTYRVNFDDWFWGLDDNNMINRSYIKKFGIVMAEVTIFMQKQG